MLRVPGLRCCVVGVEDSKLLLTVNIDISVPIAGVADFCEDNTAFG